MASHVGDELHELEARLDPRLLQALDMVAPGTPLREGIDNIIHSRTGALILIAEPDEASFLFSGGIRLDIDYTPALLYQVSKMDGAIVLDPRATKIRRSSRWRRAPVIEPPSASPSRPTPS
jgi:diadenylate cyclase